MKKTKSEYEKYLNQLFDEQLTDEEKIEKFAYILSSHKHHKKLGSLMRRFDPIQFEVGYSEWSAK